MLLNLLLQIISTVYIIFAILSCRKLGRGNAMCAGSDFIHGCSVSKNVFMVHVFHF